MCSRTRSPWSRTFDRRRSIAGDGPTFDFRLTRLAALFHDVGKPRTRGYLEGKGTTFHHHDAVGARMTRKRMNALRYSNDDVAAVTELVALHLRFHTYSMGWSDSAVRRYVRDAGDLLAELNVLTRCDCTTRNEKKAARLSRRMDELEARIDELEAAEELAALRPELDGTAVMEHLGIGPGREVGDAMKFLMDIRLDEGLLGDDEIRRPPRRLVVGPLNETEGPGPPYIVGLVLDCPARAARSL